MSIRIFIVALFCIWLSSCAILPQLNSPEVSLLAIEPLKNKGLSARFKLRLLVTNPNDIDLDIDGVAFRLEVADQKILAGMANRVPLLVAYSETTIEVEASVSLFDLFSLIQTIGKANKKAINYRLETMIDPNGFIPFNLVKTGILSDEVLSGLNGSR